jgi:hypothetical protein
MQSIRKTGKIVIVSQHCAPDPSTTATYLTAIAEGLKTDCEVLVISGTAHSASPAISETVQPQVVDVATWTPEKDALVRRAIAMVLLSVKTFSDPQTCQQERCGALCDNTVCASIFGHVGD